MSYEYTDRKLMVYSDAYAVVVDVDGEVYSSVLESGSMFIYNIPEPQSVSVTEFTREEWESRMQKQNDFNNNV